MNDIYSQPATLPDENRIIPTIHLVRHAQGFHNLSVENESLPDPDLTPLGEHQCSDLRAAFPFHSKLVKLIASPLRRTIHTCNLSFGGPGMLYPIILLDILQEVSSSPCDTGSSKEKLLEEFGDHDLDPDGVRDDWTNKGKGSVFEPTVEALMARAKEARRKLKEIAEVMEGDIAVVTHGGFLHFLTDDWEGIPSGKATAWTNCMRRSYTFEECPDDETDVRLVETQESREQRQHDAKPLTLTERRELKAAVQAKIAPYLHINA
ncbi:hypothetical protein E4U59_000363 [Claviceps monticola]|nr:hypothetical protein E4U59_000363 [Claviceps monticola]